MKRAWVLAIAVVALGAGAIVKAQAPRSVAVQMKAAQQKAEVEGDLKGAIEEYKKVVAAAGINRALAAEALVRMAGCYQKLGVAEAHTIYQRVLREFGDQKDAVAEARRHVSGANTNDAGLQTRWSGAGVNTEGTVSPDGRYLSYSDPKTGDLAIRDLEAGTSRRLTAAPGDFLTWAQFSTISRDGRQVAYAWFDDTSQLYQLRILPIDATPQTIPRVMKASTELGDVTPCDWSPDGKWLAVRVSRPDRTNQIGLVATSDLSLTVLKSIDWRGSTKMFFSPDGRFLAYDLPAGQSSQQRDVFVLRVDGSAESVAVAHSSSDVVLGWADDGQSLMFASDRTGAMGLWSVPMTNGKPAGTALLMRPNLGPVIASLGATRSGTLMLGFNTSGPNIFTAPIEESTGRLTAPAKPLVDGYLQANRNPSWSRDGKAIVYLSNRAIGPSHLLSGTSFLVIQSLETGSITELQPLLSWFLTPTFAPDGSITVDGSDAKGRRGIFRVDRETGAVSDIVISPLGNCTSGYSWSVDGKFLAYRLGCNTEQLILVRDMLSGQERPLIRGKDLAGPALSPDGKLIAYVDRDAVTKTNTLAVMPLDGGDPKPLLRVSTPVRLADRFVWSADGRHILIARSEAGQNRPIRVSLDGGEPLQYDPKLPWTMRIHPDGQRVAFSDGDSAYEVRSLKIGAPTASGKR